MQGLYVEKLKEESFPHCDIQQSVDEKPELEKYPENYTTCVNFFQVLNVLWNVFTKSGMGRAKEIIFFIAKHSVVNITSN